MNEYLTELYNQLGAHRLKVMVGAKNFTYSNEDNYLSFRHMKGNKVNYTKIAYDTSLDLYNVEFGRIHGHNYTVVSEAQGVFADRLLPIFEETTGLATHL